MSNNVVLLRKKEAFEYLLKCLLEWREDLTRQAGTSFSKTQALKLLFFTACIKVNNNDLLDVFDRFYAMQFGPVESDIYNAISQNELIHFCQNEFGVLQQLQNNAEFRIEQELKQRVVCAVCRLRELSPNIVLLPASELVDISHSWACWESAFRAAELLGRGSLYMSKEMIEQSNQRYI